MLIKKIHPPKNSSPLKLTTIRRHCQQVASLGGCEGCGPHRVTPIKGVKPLLKMFYYYRTG